MMSNCGFSSDRFTADPPCRECEDPRYGEQTTLIKQSYSSNVLAARWKNVRGREEALQALQEIVSSTLGCEDFAVFLVEGDVLKLVAYCGSSLKEIRDIPIAEGRI